MKVAKINEIENEQMVLLPEEFQFDSSEVFIQKIGEMVVLSSDKDILENLGTDYNA